MVNFHLGEGHGKRFISYEELYNDVLKFAEALKSLGVKKGDRVAAYIPNCAEAIIAMLATTSLGALWRYVLLESVCVRETHLFILLDVAVLLHPISALQ